MQRKEYNPCGELTGKERELCAEAAENYFNLPFVEVMRAVSIGAMSDLEREENFNNRAALENWASYNLNEIERRANLNFDTFTPLQSGLCKYLVHVLYENRYNIHYNALANFCCKENMSAVELEREINSLAQTADYFSTINALTDELLNFCAAKSYPLRNLIRRQVG